MKTNSVILEKATAIDLNLFVNAHKAEVVQVLKASPLIMNGKTGAYFCDYLIIYKAL